MVDNFIIISKAIKENKWINIEYKNAKDEITNYWIYILDINPKTKKAFCYIFNDAKSLDSKKVFIDLTKIISASVLDMTGGGHNANQVLIKKIERNPLDFAFLKFSYFNRNVLRYYEECYALDNDPYIDSKVLIEGINRETFKQNGFIKLNDTQEKAILKLIKKSNKNNKLNSLEYIVFALLSYEIRGHTYLVAYKNILFNPDSKELYLDDEVRFNSTLLINGVRNSLFEILEDDVDNFMNLYLEDPFKGAEFLDAHLDTRGIISTLPDFIVLKRNLNIHLDKIFNGIEEEYLDNSLEAPLKAFFGSLSKASYRRIKEPSIVIYDDKVNINQIDVVYNAMKYPVTYVQGPPGTGKTQTILNVVVSALFNSKTILITSDNNKPIDGILEKLHFEYKDKTYNFPFLRLGNMEDVKNAVITIKNLYNIKTKQKPIENMLLKIKDTNNKKNKVLVEKIHQNNEKEELGDIIKTYVNLYNNAPDSKFGKLLKETIDQYKNKYESIKTVTNKDIENLYLVASNDPKMKEFFYFKSLQYINNLHKSKYEELIDICNDEDLDKAASELNKYISNSDNLKLLTDAFPIILTTTSSSYRLGDGKFKFDLVVIDEASQCNVCRSLIPISKAKNLLLLGDPRQLKPVIVLDERLNKELMKKYSIRDEYSYTNNSILNLMLNVDSVSKFIFLQYHYRCGKKIINFSNKRYYGSELNLEYLKNSGDLKLLDIKSNPNNILVRNTNYDEAKEIVSYIKRNNLKDAMIITPFVHQKELLKSLLNKENIKDIDVGTIHSLQGSEKNTIILSSAISLKTSKRTIEWINKNKELINVALTRAKNDFVFACDTEALKINSKDKNNDLLTLANYMSSNGTSEVIPALKSLTIDRSNGSINEEEFAKTIGQFCSVYKDYKAERQISFEKIFKGSDEFKNCGCAFDFVLYRRKNVFSPTYIPLIAIEVDGGEHLFDKKRQYYDALKVKKCREMGIKLLRIGNRARKHYEEIKRLIFAAQKAKNYKQLQLNLDNESNQEE